MTQTTNIQSANIEFTDGFSAWYAARSDREFMAWYNAQRGTDALVAQGRWIHNLVGREYQTCRDFSIFPSFAHSIIRHEDYIKYVLDIRQAKMSPLPPVFCPSPLYGITDPPENCLDIVLNVLPYLNNQTEIIDFLCNSPSHVIFNVIVSREECDDYISGNALTITPTALNDLASSYHFVPYHYHAIWDRWLWVHHYIIYKTGEQRIIAGARGYWTNLDRVLELESRFDRESQSLKDEIIAVYGDLTGKSVIDLGCGVGRIPRIFPSMQCYHGVDQSVLMLNRAKRACPRAQFTESTIEDHKDDNHYDVALIIDVLQHLERPENMIFSVLQNTDADVYLFRSLLNNIDGAQFHYTKKEGTTSISYGMKRYEDIVDAIQKGSYPIKDCTADLHVFDSYDQHRKVHHEAMRGIYLVIRRKKL